VQSTATTADGLSIAEAVESSEYIEAIPFTTRGSTCCAYVNYSFNSLHTHKKKILIHTSELFHQRWCVSRFLHHHTSTRTSENNTKERTMGFSFLPSLEGQDDSKKGSR